MDGISNMTPLDLSRYPLAVNIFAKDLSSSIKLAQRNATTAIESVGKVCTKTSATVMETVAPIACAAECVAGGYAIADAFLNEDESISKRIMKGVLGAAVVGIVAMADVVSGPAIGISFAVGISAAFVKDLWFSMAPEIRENPHCSP
ncbi:hypothetical protein CF326_g6074 [Tilletia indica]|nr:hypothetical protein CF326_g6074 [Tilletia indica]